MPAWPHVSVSPRQRFGDPAVSGKGISVAAVVEQVWAGASIAEVCHDFGLTRGDVLVACWHAGRAGLPGRSGNRPTRLWIGRWGEWSRSVERALTYAESVEDYDAIPDPPDRAGAGGG